MKLLLNFMELTYYTPLVLLVETFITAVIAFHNRHKFKILRFFPYYILLSAAQTLLCFILIIYRPVFAVRVSGLSIYVFIVLEFFVVYFFLFEVIRSRYFKKIMYILMALFISIIIYSWYSEHPLSTTPISVSLTNSLCLIIPCLFYFYETFKSPPMVSLSKQPAFWIVTGFLFMITCTLPFYLLEDYIHENMLDLYVQIYILNNVFYCLLFLLISKAFLCKSEISK